MFISHTQIMQARKLLLILEDVCVLNLALFHDINEYLRF